MNTISRRMILGLSSAWLLPPTSWAAKPVMLASPGHPPLARLEKKTGTAMAPGMPDKYNDIAIAWPPGRAPIIVTAYFETRVAHGGRLRDEDQAVLAQVGRIAAEWVLRA